MKLRKMIKKIVAVGMGATFLGAALTGAMAADLSKYPAPFIQDGKFSGTLVVGDKAAAEDVIGVSDIAVSLQYAAKKKTGTIPIKTDIEGDVWKVGTSSKKLEITQSTDSASNFGNESIRDIMSSIDKGELKALADGSIRTEKGTSSYSQYINFEDSAREGGYVKFLENDEDEASDFLYFKSGSQIARYSLEFKTSLQSDVEDSTGSKTTTGTFLGDIEDEKITILGKDYTIVKARRVNSNGNNIELTLMGGAIKDTLYEGETKTYTINGNDYEVTVMAITDTGTPYVKFIVNGQTTRSLKDGDSTMLADGIELGIVDLIPNEAGDVTQDLVEFYLGASKIYLKDSNIRDAVSSNALEYGSEKIDDAYVIITGSDDNSTFSIDTIQLNITADDDYFVAAGHKLTEYMDEPQAFLGSLDIRYYGLDPSIKTETYKLKASGSDTYKLEFTDGDGNLVSLPLAYTSSGSTLELGNKDNNLALNGSVIIRKNDYLVVTDNHQDDGNRRTYALRYKGAEKVASGETAIVKFDNLGTSKRIEQVFTENSGDTADAKLKLGGATFGIINASTATVDDFDIQVDLDGDGAITSDTDVVAINTKAGLKIAIDNSTANQIDLIFSTPNSNHYDNMPPSDVRLTITASNREVRFDETAGDDIDWTAPSEERNVKYAYTSMGAKFKWDDPTNDPDELVIEYPKEQRLPLIYITIGDTKVITETGESVESVTINKIEVGATKLASEVADVTAQNVILVGGPCANSATSNLLGNPEDCTEGFEPNAARIELYENNGKVAMLVAGYYAKDTRDATEIIASYYDYKDELKGNAVKVKGVNGVLKITKANPLKED